MNARLLLNQSTARRQRLRLWSVVLIAATFIATIYAVRNLVGTLGGQRPFDWGWTIGYEFLYWYIWAAFTPLILWFAARSDLDGPGRARAIAALVLFGLLIAPLQAAIENAAAISIDLLRAVGTQPLTPRITSSPAQSSSGGLMIRCTGLSPRSS
jgi:hypothetical protein